MARASSGLQYPERFYAAASYVGFDGSSPTKSLTSKFPQSTALLLYSLYQQASVGPCNITEPSTWKIVEHGKWASWNQLGNMSSTEAMRLFVKILEEEDPGWYSRLSNSVVEPVIDVQMNHNSKVEPVIENGNSYPETKTISISTQNGSEVGTQDKDTVVEGFGSVEVYDQWIAPPVSGGSPKARYEVLDLRSWTWSKIEAKTGVESPTTSIPCAGHSLIPWGNKLLSIAGHTKDPSESIQVKVFDLQMATWSTPKIFGKAPVSRGGQSVNLVGKTLVIFGGQDAKRTLLNDLHILDLETMTWDEIDAVGVPPSPRSDHTAAVHVERYLLIFGGGSHATCYNDLHVLDLQTMEWSRPMQLGEIPTPRAGHAGVTVGENWFIVGGGDNKSGVSETIVLNMSTLAWSVVTSVQGRVPVASEGLSLVVSSYDGEDVLVSFGGYNGRYNNEVYVLKPSHKSTLQSKIIENSIPDSVSAIPNVTNKSKGDIVSVLKAEKEELESSLVKEKHHALQLKQDLAEAESFRGQLASEQSRCFKLEVEVAELGQKLQTIGTLQKELELLQRQKAASEQAALNAKQRQSSGGVWGWLAGTPPPIQNADDA
ncbi:Acyl-CoA-binding domain-containing protein 4 [Glycine max]|nr:Acyl-CoA-binding domain-containing protein 4 [Glycine max]